MIAQPPTIDVCDVCVVANLNTALRRARAGVTIIVHDEQHGNFVVRVPDLTISGDAILDGGGRGTVLTIDAPSVTVRGLSIRDSGASFVAMDAGIRSNAPHTTLDHLHVANTLFGIYFARSNYSIIKDSQIEGRRWIAVPERGDAVRVWYSRDTRIIGNHIDDARDDLIWFSKNARIYGNTIAHGRYGLHFMYSDGAKIESNVVRDCEVGSYGMYSRHWEVKDNLFVDNRGSTGYGIGLKAIDDAVVSGNAFVSNHSGVYIDNSPSLVDATVRFTHNLFAYNEFGIESLPAEHGDIFLANSFVDNYRQVAALGGGTLKGVTWAQNGAGNYWSDYAGYDRKGDGIGDVPYQTRSLYGSLADMDPRLDLLVYSPAATALEFAVHALPLFAPPDIVDDTSPLMRPVYPQSVPRLVRTGSSATYAWAGVVALFASLGVLFRRRPRVRKNEQIRVQESAGSAISVQIFRKAYGKTPVLEGIKFDVGRGEVVALWGPNGSGKTTLIRCMLGIVEFEGSVDRVGAFGYVPQQLPAFDMRARELARFVGALRGVDDESGDECLRNAGLWDAREHSVRQLSGGQRQRLSVAISSLGLPPMLFLDEPSVGLDFESKAAILRHLRAAKEAGTTIVIATHVPEDVVKIADRVVMMDAGHAISIVSAKEFSASIYCHQEFAS